MMFPSATRTPGAGVLAAVAQIAAKEIGVRPEDVAIGDNDTASTKSNSYSRIRNRGRH
jgi:CO/xanthine dehydrogenase Mo-binding subunit